MLDSGLTSLYSLYYLEYIPLFCKTKARVARDQWPTSHHAPLLSFLEKFLYFPDGFPYTPTVQ